MDGTPEDAYATDVSGEPPVVAIVRAVAAVSNRDPTEMDPVHRVVDIDALNTLCTPSTKKRDRDEVAVTFVYNGHRVRVSDSGIVSIAPTE